MLGDGWFRGRLGFGGGRRNVYGDRPGPARPARGHLRRRRPPSGSAPTTRWRAAPRADRRPRPVRRRDATTRARSVRAGRRRASTTRDWTAVRALAATPRALVAPTGPPVRRTRGGRARSTILTSPSGATARSTSARTSSAGCGSAVSGEAGTTVTLRHAEVLEDGELGIRPLRGAARDRPLHAARRRRRGPGSRASPSTASATPRSTAGRASSSPATSRAVVCHTDMERTGWFACSDPLLDRLHENVVWGMRGNFLDVPTDCPQRDERLGWTGDIQVFAPTARFLYDCAGFLASWLRDLAAEQTRTRHGVVPFVVPDVAAVEVPTSSRPAAGLGRRRGDRAVGAVRALRRPRAPRRAVRRACGPGSTSVAEPRGRRAACGTAGSSSATGSTRPRRPTEPWRRRAPTRTSSPPPTSPAPPSSSPRPPRCSAATADADALRGASPDGVRGGASRASTSRRPAGSRATPRPPTRSRSSSRCCPTAEQRRRAGAPARRAGARRRPPHRHRLRRHAAHLRRAARAGDARHGLPPAAPARVPVVALLR